MPVILAGMFLFSCQSKKELSPEEAVRSLKVLNSDLTNLSSAGQEHPAFVAIDFLLKQASSPLSHLHGIPARLAKDSLLDIDAWKGKYVWDKDSLAFFLTDPAEDINIIFPLDKGDKNNARFVLNRYKCEPVMKRSCFPVEIEATLEYQQKKIMNIKYEAEFDDDWPTKMQCELKGESSAGFFKMDRTRDGDNGTMTIRFSFNEQGYTFLEGSITSAIGYNGSLIYTKVIKPDLTVFDVNIKGHLDYGKVDPTSHDYIQSFNDNSHIIFRETGSGKKIGDFGLGMDETGELLEWVLYLSDGSKASLYDNILVFKKFMDFKYPNKEQTN